jgi:phosphatidylglycerophosphatase B
VAFWLTESAGKYGTLKIIILTSALYTIRLPRRRDRVITFIKSAVALSIFLTVFAMVNEYVTKPSLRLSRPSHNFIINKANIPNQLDSIYRLSVKTRQDYFENLLKQNKTFFEEIDPRVLEHWIDEAGYSFPSGHSFNAFLLATVMAFSLYHVQNKFIRSLYFLPYLWALSVAISRVAIGAHTALDVCAGAALGLIVSHVFIYFDTTRRLIIYKRHIA